MGKGILGYRDVNDLLYNTVGAKNIGDLASDTLAYGGSTALGLTPLGVPLQIATGKSTADLLGYKAKTDIGKKAQVAQSIIPSAQRGILGAASGNPTAILSATQGLNQNVTGAETPMFKKGGMTNTVTINVEKGELCVDPHTLDVIDNYIDVPKHPKGKDIINQKGNVDVKVGSIIIPADMSNKFLNSDVDAKREIVKTLVERQAKDKAARGGIVVYKAKDGITPDAWDYITGVNEADALNAWEQPLGNQTFEDYQNTENQRVQNPMSTQVPYNTPQSNERGEMSGTGVSTLGLIGQAVPQYLLGRKQYTQSQKALEALNKQPYAEFKPTAETELYKGAAAGARERAKYGLLPQEQAALNQQYNRAQNTEYQKMMDIGGSGLNGAFNAVTQSQNIDKILKNAQLDSEMRRNNQRYADQMTGNVANKYQDLANRQTSFDQANRLRKEQAYGAAMRKGLENEYGAYGTTGAALGSGLSEMANGGGSSQGLMQLLPLLL